VFVGDEKLIQFYSFSLRLYDKKKKNMEVVLKPARVGILSSLISGISSRERARNKNEYRNEKDIGRK